MATQTKQISEITYTFMQVARKFAQTETHTIEVDEQHLVSTREAHMIDMIGNSRIINISKLAEHFTTSRSAASQMISKLEKRGFVCKAPAPNNAKEYRLSLTLLGQKAYAAHEKFHGKAKKAFFEKMHGFSPEQLDTVTAFLKAWEEVIDEREEAEHTPDN